MFADARSRKIVLVAPCGLNQNALSDGSADFLGAEASASKPWLRDLRFAGCT